MYISNFIYNVSMYQHAVAFVNGDQYFGAKASINVWAPRVTDQYEFSLSQLWVISGSFGNDLNTIEAGWQVCIPHSTKFMTNICRLTPQLFSLTQKKTTHLTPEKFPLSVSFPFEGWTEISSCLLSKF